MKSIIIVFVLLANSIFAQSFDYLNANLNINGNTNNSLNIHQDINKYLTIRDSSYYNRLDRIEKESFDYELVKIDTAIAFLYKDDYESAIFWAKLIDNNHFPSLDCEKNFILSISYAFIDKRKDSKKYYNRLKEYCEPVRYRAVDSIYLYLDRKNIN